MPGIVYAYGTDATVGRYGQPIAIAAGGAIPPGEYIVPGAVTITNPDGTTTDLDPGGIFRADGVSAVLAAAGDIIPMGARGENNPPVWPWPKPWPLNLT